MSVPACICRTILRDLFLRQGANFLNIFLVQLFRKAINFYIHKIFIGIYKKFFFLIKFFADLYSRSVSMAVLLKHIRPQTEAASANVLPEPEAEDVNEPPAQKAFTA